MEAVDCAFYVVHMPPDALARFHYVVPVGNLLVRLRVVGTPASASACGWLRRTAHAAPPPATAHLHRLPWADAVLAAQGEARV